MNSELSRMTLELLLISTRKTKFILLEKYTFILHSQAQWLTFQCNTDLRTSVFSAPGLCAISDLGRVTLSSSHRNQAGCHPCIVKGVINSTPLSSEYVRASSLPSQEEESPVSRSCERTVTPGCGCWY